LTRLPLILTVSLALTALTVHGQTDTTIKYPIRKHYIGFQLLGQALFSTHYEYFFTNKKYFSINSDIGIGRAEYGDDHNNPPTIGTRVIHSGVLFSFGFPSIKVVCSVHPSTYFHGKLTFVDLNGLLGIRYTPKGNFERLFVMINYTPKIYTTLTTTEYIYTHINFGARFGVCF